MHARTKSLGPLVEEGGSSPSAENGPDSVDAGVAESCSDEQKGSDAEMQEEETERRGRKTGGSSRLSLFSWFGYGGSVDRERSSSRSKGDVRKRVQTTPKVTRRESSASKRSWSTSAAANSSENRYRGWLSKKASGKWDRSVSTTELSSGGLAGVMASGGSGRSTSPTGSLRPFGRFGHADLLREDDQDAGETLLGDDNMDEKKMRECPLCFVRRPEAAFPRLIGCEHQSCTYCLTHYVRLEVMENRVEVSCPECPANLHPADVHMLLRPLGDEFVAKYEEFSLRRYLIGEQDTRWCPAPDCSYAVIASSCAACPQLRCEREKCGTLFCYHCKDVWHANATCDEARRLRGGINLPGRSGSERGSGYRSKKKRLDGAQVRRISSRQSSEATVLKPGDLKPCPRCHAYIVKMDDGSCNHMVCTMCSTEFCWLCLKEISDLHYLSPTGCTFWGKKPWTRKKKLLWQLGTLIGAPLGIALIAGLSVPGIIFGVPVLVGRKVHHRFIHHTRAKRRIVTAVCVAGSLVVSPVLAVMAVGVGVPIMLAYVYGVVPLSLCRNGGCSIMEGRDRDRNGRGQHFGDSDDMIWTGGVATNPAGRTDGHEKAKLLSSGSSLFEERAERGSGVEGARGGGGDGASLAAVTSIHSGISGMSSLFTRGGVKASGAVTSLGEDSNDDGGRRRRRRPSCESGGVLSNFEEASTKAMAGSHYHCHFDDKSVHTLSSAAAEALSYSEDVASTKALAGSVLDSKSLSGSLGANNAATVTTVAHVTSSNLGPEGATGGGESTNCVDANCPCQAPCSSTGHKEAPGCTRPVGRSVGSTAPCSSSSALREEILGVVNSMPGGGDYTAAYVLSPDDYPCTSMPLAAAASSGAVGGASSSGNGGSLHHLTGLALHPDPFKIRAIFDTMKQMIAADDDSSEEGDEDDVFRPAPPAELLTARFRRSDSAGMAMKKEAATGSATLPTAETSEKAPPTRPQSASLSSSNTSSGIPAAPAGSDVILDIETPSPGQQPTLPRPGRFHRLISTLFRRRDKNSTQ